MDGDVLVLTRFYDPGSIFCGAMDGLLAFRGWKACGGSSAKPAIFSGYN